MSEKTEKKPCPQCEGVGHEDLGAIPSKCRKCHGSGEVVSTLRVGSFLHSCEGLEKRAQVDIEAPSEDHDDVLGPGFDQLSILPPDMTPMELKNGIFSILGGLSPDEMKLALKEVCDMKGIPEAQAVEKSQGGPVADHNTKNYVYTSVDDMDIQKLRNFYRILRSLSNG